MASDAIPTHYKLLGENDSIWGILALILVGIITSITTAYLLLPPGMTIATLYSTTRDTDHPEHSSEPSIPAPSTIDVARDSNEVLLPDLPPIEHGVKSEHDDSAPSEDSAGSDKASVTDDQSDVKPKTGAEKPPLSRIKQSEQHTVPLATQKALSALAEFAVSEAPVTIDPAGFESRVEHVNTPDCAPLFVVRFMHDGIQPIESDLAGKVHKLRDWLKLHPQAELRVEGHADASGPDEYNLFISDRRAKAVSNLLAKYGISKERMAIRALGEYSPLIGVPPESAKNRRVSLRIEDVSACSSLITDGNER